MIFNLPMKICFAILLAVIISFATGCHTFSKGDAQSQIREHALSFCKETENCQITLADVKLPFEWDKLYFYDLSVQNEKIVSLTGIDANFKGLSTFKFMFTKNNLLTHAEEHGITFDGYKEDSIVFGGLTGEPGSAIFTPQTKFSAKFYKIGSGDYLVLNPLTEP